MTLPNRVGYSVSQNQKKNLSNPVSPQSLQALEKPFRQNEEYIVSSNQLANVSPIHNGSFTEILDSHKFTLPISHPEGPYHFFDPSMQAVEATAYNPSENLSGDNDANRKRKGNVKGDILETFSPEEVIARKNAVKSNKLLPNILQVISETKREGMLPAVTLNSMDHLLNPLYGITNEPSAILDKETSYLIIDDFLATQGIEVIAAESREESKVEERQRFVAMLDQLKATFRDEVERLDRVCSDFCCSVLQTLKEQSIFRCVSEEEFHLKIATIRSKFIHTKNKLCHSVFRTILVLHSDYNQIRKKNKTLPKRATEILIQWFFDHLNDPYPDENEKAAIGVACRLTLTQVHNWFGNKRIRYKHKCMEEETKRTRKQKKVIEPKVI